MTKRPLSLPCYVIQSITDLTGTTTLDLIHFTCVITTAYHGINLDSKITELKADSELTSLCKVYKVTFKGFNVLNQSVKGAEVLFLRNATL